MFKLIRQAADLREFGDALLRGKISVNLDWIEAEDFRPLSPLEGTDQWLFIESRALEPFQNRFDGVEVDRDPLDMPFWSFGMATVWIMCKSQNAARHYWSGPMEAALIEPNPDDPAVKRVVTFRAAQNALMSSMASGKISATAFSVTTNDIHKIEPHEWPHLRSQLRGSSNGVEFSFRRDGIEYRNIRMKRDDVIRLWPCEVPASNPSDTKSDAQPDRMRWSEAELRKQGEWMFLGQALDWIICRGTPCTAAVYNARWDEAERELFRFLDGGLVAVQGYPADGMTRTYETLPEGIWARMNGEDASKDPQFNPIDDTREDGGTVWVGDQKWYGVRVLANEVFERWPVTNIPPIQAVRRGARPKYDWDAFNAAAMEKLEDEGFFDPSVDPKWNKAALERYMTQWCEDNWEMAPVESTIRNKLTAVEAGYVKGRKGRD